MARINIEEKWWSDPRRSMLINKLHNGDRVVDGIWLVAIKLAQQYWIPKKELIPIKTWNGCDMPKELFDVGLAELSEDGKFVYVSGSKDNFEWWFLKQEAGRRGGLAKANNAKQSLVGASKSKQGLPSSSSSSSSSSSCSKKDSVDFENCNTELKSNSAPNPLVVEVIEFLNKRVGGKFKTTSKHNQKLVESLLAEGHTLEEFQKVIEAQADNWLDDAKMKQHLVPTTLFRPVNFEKYLGAASVGSGNYLASLLEEEMDFTGGANAEH